MSDFLAPALRYPGFTQVEIPPAFSYNKHKLTGTLYLSRQGYVFSFTSKVTIWLKFLGIAIGLPIIAIAAKCNQLFNCCWKGPKKGLHDLKHSFNLVDIAWKAVIGTGRNNLMNRVEEFALAELDYNHNDRMQALELRRSDRFEKGVYMARCMQPLMHKDQYTVCSRTRKKIEELEKQYTDLSKEYEYNDRNDSWSTVLYKSVMTEERPYREWSKATIQKTMQENRAQVKTLQDKLQKAERCNKCAFKAIYDQQCCIGAMDSFEDNFVTTEADVKCCGERCYRQQRICGIVYKIDCCATRCWAIDCLCCFCCFWPAGRQACVL